MFLLFTWMNAYRLFIGNTFQPSLAMHETSEIHARELMNLQNIANCCMSQMSLC